MITMESAFLLNLDFHHAWKFQSLVQVQGETMKFDMIVVSINVWDVMERK
jgi:hypothetical protein